MQPPPPQHPGVGWRFCDRFDCPTVFVPNDWTITPGYFFPPPLQEPPRSGEEHEPAPMRKLTIRESIQLKLNKSREEKYADYSSAGRNYSSEPGGSIGPPILYEQPDDWGITFYIRIDRKGSFHTYPHVGGPYKNLKEANNAIAFYLNARQDKKLLMGLSGVEIAVQRALYLPDGRRRKHLRSQPIDKSRDSARQLVEALVDKYNEDHNLLGDLAYEFKDIVCYQTIREGGRCYEHINFITKAKEADNFNFDIDKLFFAEVMYKQGELFVNRLCMVKHTDNGNCYGCKNKGSADMKHPDEFSYIGGHTNNAIGVPKILHRDFDKEETEEELEAEKARLRWLFGGSHEMKQKGTLTMEGQGDSPRELKRMETLTMEGQGDGLGQSLLEAEKAKLRWRFRGLHEMKQKVTLTMEEGRGDGTREAKRMRTFTMDGQGEKCWYELPRSFPEAEEEDVGYAYCRKVLM